MEVFFYYCSLLLLEEHRSAKVRVLSWNFEMVLGFWLFIIWMKEDETPNGVLSSMKQMACRVSTTHELVFHKLKNNISHYSHFLLLSTFHSQHVRDADGDYSPKKQRSEHKRLRHERTRRSSSDGPVVPGNRMYAVCYKGFTPVASSD